MAKYQPYYDRFRRKNHVPAVCVSLVIIAIGTAGLWVAIHSSGLQSDAKPRSTVADVVSSPLPEVLSTPVNPHGEALSEADRANYRRIFSLQQSANWKLADEYIADLTDNILLGDVLAERYLHRRYNTSKSEIISWLKNYRNHSQAIEIVELAVNKYPELASKLPKIEKPKRLQGYGDSNGDDLRFADNQPAKKIWLSGIELWRANKKSEAAKAFSQLVDKKNDVSEWQYSAAGFWAYRCYLALGNKNKAEYYLTKSAENPRVFYGILARKQLGKNLELDSRHIEMNVADVRKVLLMPEVRRIVALAQSGLNEMAESQIRLLFPSASKQEKWVLLSLSERLNLASAQIGMAKQLENSDRRLDALKYPIPQWQPSGGFNIDPNLIYAMMRQESGFHVSAESGSGAIGLMQLMPQTARKMQKSDIVTREMLESVAEPVYNVTLGERYVRHLLDNGLVNGNLFYMLTAYNAGAKKLKEWQDDIAYHDDPLLFVESIPYSETRHYIIQVMTDYWLYSELSDVKNNSIYALLRGDWPSYFQNPAPVADAGKRNRDG